MMKLNIDSKTRLNNGIDMPVFGLGVWKSQQGGEVEFAIQTALETGYRSIDTASMYLNEEGVGKAIRESGLPRAEIFVTSKVWNSDQGYENTIAAINRSLEKLKLDYLDLYLIHWPVAGKFNDTWRAMEEIQNTGLARAVGVSNFMKNHLEELLKFTEFVPAINQIEFHPYLIQQDLLDYCNDQNIRIEAWSPLMQGRVNDLRVLADIGKKHGKSAAQIVLRWNLQRDIITIPKSSNPVRIRENADIFDFELNSSDIEQINALDRNQRFGPDPHNFNF